MPSNVPGYLRPDPTPAPLEDDALDDFLGHVVAGVTGLDRKLVRPRWQEEPPNMPERNVTWCAMGVVGSEGDTSGYEALAADGVSAALQRQEQLTFLATFYGPTSGKTAREFRDGLLIAQNREALSAAGFALVDAKGPTNAPELIKEKWYQRSDIRVRLNRQVNRVYEILSILSAQGTIYDEHRAQTFDTLDGPIYP